MTIDLDGNRFAFDDRGNGRPILFIHGYPLSRKLWTPQIDYLSRCYRTIALDLRGHGETQEIPGPYTMDMLAKDCNTLLDKLHIEVPVVLCGLSMGGYVSLAFLRRYPARVAGLILAATRANADSIETQGGREKAIATASEHGSTAIAESMLPKMFALDTYCSNPILVDEIRGMMARTSVEGIIGALNGIKNRNDSTNLLPLIQVPTLIIHGAEDQLIPVTVAQDMHSAIPGSTLTVLPGTGHLLNREQPMQFNQALENYLSTHQ